MNINMDLFYIVISCIFVFLLVAGVVLMVIDSRMDYKRKKAVAQKIESGRGMRLEGDDLILKVTDGKVEILEDLPAPEVAAAAAPARGSRYGNGGRAGRARQPLRRDYGKQRYFRKEQKRHFCG